MTINTAKKVFRKEEISSAEKFYAFLEKKKLITFVPEHFTEKIMKELSKTGAGSIGNYSMCSFRTKGTGTFLPGKMAEPFYGSKNKLSHENEIKLEMECNASDLNEVINSLLKHHPYEEAVYEIYTFMKREKTPSGFCISLKKRLRYSELFGRMNRGIDEDFENDRDSFKKIVITDADVTDTVTESAKLTGSDCLLYISKSIYKLFKL